MKLLCLRDRRSRICRLAPDEVQYLLQQHREYLELRPTTKQHCWQITPRGIVGVILTPRRRITIDSKIAISKLLFMEEVTSVVPGLTPTNQVLEQLVDELARRMIERASAGLQRGYRQRAYQGPRLLGALDLTAQLRQPLPRTELHSRLDEFTVDLPCNQVPKSLAMRLQQSPLISLVGRQRLSRALSLYELVQPIDLSPEIVLSLAREPVPQEYRSLVELCLLLVGLAGSSVKTNTSLVISLERWFERYVYRAAKTAFGESARYQETYQVGEPGILVRPDVTVWQSDSTRIVLDAKWKRLSPQGPESADLYQILAYAGLLGASQAVLVYPGTGRPRTLTFPRSPVRLHLCQLSVTGSARRFVTAMSQLE